MPKRRLTTLDFENLSVFIDFQLLYLIAPPVRGHEDGNQIDFTSGAERTECVLDVGAARSVGDVEGLGSVGAEKRAHNLPGLRFTGFYRLGSPFPLVE